jgi:signal transduction histidine kinase
MHNNRIILGAILIAMVGIISTASVLHYITSQTITQMALDELTHLVTATSNMIRQSASQAVVNHLRALAESHLKTIEYIYSEYQSGKISEPEARRRARNFLLKQTIGDSGYIYCVDSQGVIRAHPKRQLINADLSQYAFIQYQMQHKNGYLEYDWKNPGETKVRPKALYMIYFAPWDWIISASSYRQEFNRLVSARDFEKDVLSIRIGKSGYLYILNSQGQILLHPSLKSGCNVSAMRDTQGFYFFQEILRSKNGTIRYWWKNPGEKHARNKIVVYKYFPAFDWIIAGGSYLDELYEPLNRMRINAFYFLLLNCLFAAVISALFGRGIISSQKASDMAIRSALNTTEKIIDLLPIALVLIDADEKISRANEAAGQILKTTPNELIGCAVTHFIPSAALATGQSGLAELEIKTAQGKSLTVMYSEITIKIGEKAVALAIFLDVSERIQMEAQLRHAQKLESVGQLAAGIAHEINTPIQYLGDNLHFLAEAFNSLRHLLQEFQPALAQLAGTPEGNALLQKIKETQTAEDIAYVLENIPPSFQGAREGISRISTIVSAMKEFVHPDNRAMVLVNLNHALEVTLTIARNEYKYVADVETVWGTIPEVLCHSNDINQVFLNLIVNAAHAIGETADSQSGRGKITIRTAMEEGFVRIEIEDTGAGIPEAIRERIFDPFFTTKPVGKGTGQGLAIARAIVVEKHHGTLTFSSEVGKGTCFFIRLPFSVSTESKPYAPTATVVA